MRTGDHVAIPRYGGAVPYLTTAQMIAVDRLMVEKFEIALSQMMENAGRHLAHLARQRFLGSNPRGKRVVVLAGAGGNGGGALVGARHLHNWGADVRVHITRPDGELQPVTGHQLAILRHMNVPVAPGGAGLEAVPPELIIDGLIGYGLTGAPRGAAAELIRWANGQPAPILSLDTPSGLDTTTGLLFDPAVRAAATMTLALPKTGLRAPGAEDAVGELYLADISVPPGLYANPPLELVVGHIFAEGEIVRLP
jgi:NAD(P)H-hydrate epimerase